ncbi:unnamed protein product [Mytilus coruscus]|uniref:Uncharacterized protein n=1 Tax=Mytilus coruscus TaxID=42192 RepID=A0A6J8EDJ8_MYTCO|nr:unnamed protein product [Mytilus coruscus]
MLLFCIYDEALQCLQCVDGTFDHISVHTLFRGFIQNKVKAIKSPECENATSGDKAAKITFGSCNNDPGKKKINKCGTLTGIVFLTQSGAKIEINGTMVARGCFAVDKNITEGCYTETNILNEQKTVFVEKFGVDIKQFDIQIGDINNGKFCISGSSTFSYMTVLLLLTLKLKLLGYFVE